MVMKGKGLERITGVWRGMLVPYCERLAPRERQLLLAAAVILPLLVYLFAFLLPMHDKAERLQRDLPGLAAQLAEAEQLSDQLQRHGTQTMAGDLLHVVEAAAAATEVRDSISRMKPQDGDNGRQTLLVSLRKVPYPQLVRFLAALGDKGVGLDEARLMKSGNGVLDVELVLRNG